MAEVDAKPEWWSFNKEDRRKWLDQRIKEDKDAYYKSLESKDAEGVKVSHV